MFSPDGNAFVYFSDGSGEDRVYLRLFPDVHRRWPISESAATGPLWSRDGCEIFFLQDDRMMAVRVDLQGGVRIGTPKALFATSDYATEPFGNPLHDVAKDGRFLMVRRGAGARTWRWIQNWGKALQELRAR